MGQLAHGHLRKFGELNLHARAHLVLLRLSGCMPHKRRAALSGTNLGL